MVWHKIIIYLRKLRLSTNRQAAGTSKEAYIFIYLPKGLRPVELVKEFPRE
jgi:hypothetical protein